MDRLRIHRETRDIYGMRIPQTVSRPEFKVSPRQVAWLALWATALVGVVMLIADK